MVELFELDDAIKGIDELEIMGDNHQASPVLLGSGKHAFKGFLFVVRVEIAGGLIGEEKSGAHAERPADCCALPFAVREYPGEGIPVLKNVELVSQFLRSLLDRGSPLSQAKMRWKQYVVTNGQVFNQLKFLEDQSDAGKAKCR